MNVYDFPNCCGFKIITGFGDIKDAKQAEQTVARIMDFVKKTRTAAHLVALGHPDPVNGKGLYSMKVHQFGLKEALEKAGFVQVIGEHVNPNMSEASRVSLWALSNKDHKRSPVEDGFRRIDEDSDFEEFRDIPL